MTEDFSIDEPARYFQTFVLRSYNQHAASRADQLHAKTAVHYANVMAERMWNFYKDTNPGVVGLAKDATGYRKSLVDMCPDFQLIWDVDDGHKHVRLTRPGRRISTAGQVGKRVYGGALNEEVLNAAPLAGEIETIMILLDDKTERPLTEVLTNIIAMWKDVVSKL